MNVFFFLLIVVAADADTVRSRASFPTMAECRTAQEKVRVGIMQEHALMQSGEGFIIVECQPVEEGREFDGKKLSLL